MTEIIVAIIAAVGSVITVAITNHSANKRVEKRVEEIESQMNLIRKHDEKQYLGILRLTVMNENMPISERIAAGKEYIDHGGNGDVKAYFQQLLKDHTK